MEWWHKGGTERAEFARMLRKIFRSKRNRGLEKNT
jgi:hypothetical protein